jgi:hypothetical protein
MSNIVNEYIIGCDFMKFDEFKIDGVEIKINDEYALINGTIEIMLSQISEVIIVDPDWLGIGRLELKLKNSELGFNHVFYCKNKQEFEDMLKLKERIENR